MMRRRTDPMARSQLCAVFRSSSLANLLTFELLAFRLVVFFLRDLVTLDDSLSGRIFTGSTAATFFVLRFFPTERRLTDFFISTLAIERIWRMERTRLTVTGGVGLRILRPEEGDTLENLRLGGGGTRMAAIQQLNIKYFFI